MKTPKSKIREYGVITVTLLLLVLLNSCTEEEFNPEFTRTFTIESQSINATYPIQVALPETYNSSDEKFSTIYVLDGDQDFDFVANTCKSISDRNMFPNVIVVSIGYGRDRSIDYTPTKTGSSTGGASEFLSFIENELIPKIERDFRVEKTRESRAILGHSYGGLFGAYAFAVNNKVFGNYIMLSPSLWFDNEIAMVLEKEHRNINKDIFQSVFLGIGEAENIGQMQAPFEAYYKTLLDNYSDMRISKHREDDLSHMGSKDANIVKGLNHYFENR